MNIGLLFRFGIIIQFLVCASCYTGRINISVLEPATITIPAAIKRVSLFPGAGIPDPIGTIDSISEIPLEPDYDYNRLKRGYMDGVFATMSESPRFLKVVKADTIYEYLLSTGYISWEELNSICTRDTTDAVLVLKKAVSRDLLQRYEIPGIPCGILYQMINQTKWSFFQPFLQKEFGNMLFTDTIVFDFGNVDCFAPFILRDIPDVIYESFHNTGSRMGLQISPSWHDSISRIYFTGPGKELHYAAQLAVNNQWNQASVIWNRLSESDNRRLASHASFNMALAWERDDELDQALLWISYSDSLFSSGKTLVYKKALENRLKNRAILNQQMTGN
jgi:hypothetical protein